MTSLTKELQYTHVYLELRSLSRNYFESAWAEYLKLRGLESGQDEPVFPENWGVRERDAYYSKISWSGWGGASGHDSTIIA